MALTKSLHTVTAATNVAKLLLATAPHRYGGGPASLAAEALKALEQALDGSETSQRIVANCRTLLADQHGDA